MVKTIETSGSPTKYVINNGDGTKTDLDANKLWDVLKTAFPATFADNTALSA